MNFRRFLLGQVRRHTAPAAKRRLLREGFSSSEEKNLNHWEGSLADPTRFYLSCFRYFHFRMPEQLRTHRAYFETGQRGFGEDAFHTMWMLLFQRFPIQNYLEIGVYRGQTLSLAALLQYRAGIACVVAGISPFEAAGDTVSRYLTGIDYHADTLANFEHFNLPKPLLLRAYSTDPAAIELIRSRSWDCIYIDGSHDYEIARADWENCSAAIKPGGLVVLDDSALFTDFDPPPFATKGHPGPSRLAEEIDRSQFTEILRVGHNRVFQRIDT